MDTDGLSIHLTNDSKVISDINMFYVYSDMIIISFIQLFNKSTRLRLHSCYILRIFYSKIMNATNGFIPWGIPNIGGEIWE